MLYPTVGGGVTYAYGARSMAHPILEAAGLEDVFADTETNAYADVVLPAALWTESEGVLINSERNLTLARPAADAPGEAMADWRIIAGVAREMGFEDGFSYDSAEEVFEEIKRAWNPKTGWDLRGISYDRLRETPVQWPAAPTLGHEPLNQSTAAAMSSSNSAVVIASASFCPRALPGSSNASTVPAGSTR